MMKFYPPKDVQEAAREGLRLYEAGFGGKGLVEETIRWARKVARGEPVDAAKSIKGNAWHARHYVDRRPGWEGKESGGVWVKRPTPGYVAYLLWFGAPGKRWFAQNVAKVDAFGR